MDSFIASCSNENIYFGSIETELRMPSHMDANSLLLDCSTDEIANDRMISILIDNSLLQEQDELWPELLHCSQLEDEDIDFDTKPWGRNSSTMTDSCLESRRRNIEHRQVAGSIRDIPCFRSVLEDENQHAVISNEMDHIMMKSLNPPFGQDLTESLVQEQVECDSHFEACKSRSRHRSELQDANVELLSHKKAKLSEKKSNPCVRSISCQWTPDDCRQGKVISRRTQRSETMGTVPEKAPIARGRATHNGSRSSNDSRWAEQLLGASAIAVAGNDMGRIQHLMWVLNDLAYLSGDTNQRLAGYGLKALFCRVAGSGELSSSYSLPNSSFIPSDPRALHRAFLRFYDASPWHHMVYSVANWAILDACEGHTKIHVVDIGVSQGTQWPTFIEALATRPSGPPTLMRLTTVEDLRSIVSGKFQIGSSTEFVGRLQPFATKMGLKLELHTVSVPLDSLKREHLGLKEDELLIICTQFRLHQLQESEDSIRTNVIPASPRDAFLKFLHDLNPHLFVMSENDVDHCSPDFLTRFEKVVDFQWRFLDSTNASFKGRECEERQIIENQAAMALHNNVACEGISRIERNESHWAWRSRTRKAGFLPHPPKEEIVENAKSLLKKYDAHWDMEGDEACIVLRWKRQPTTFCSLWK